MKFIIGEIQGVYSSRAQTLCSDTIVGRQVSVLYVLCGEGMFAIRAERDYVIEEDFLKGVRKIADNKKLETKLDYKPV